MDSVLYTLAENIREQNYVIATYYIKLPKETDVFKKASTLAIGQTIGTWIPIPGITDEIREKYMGKVVNIFDVPSLDLATQIDTNEREYIIQIAYPAVNFSTDLPLMITSLLGNDASTSAQVKLLDIEFPEKYASEFEGPSYGSEGIRKFAGIQERPILLNMIKPCTGLTPKDGAKIFYETAVAANDDTGEPVKYLGKVPRGAGESLEIIRRVDEAGADGIMVNFAAVGYSVLQEVTEATKLPVLGHAAGSGMFYEGVLNGMSSPLAAGKLARLAGADIVMVNTPYGGYPLKHQKYMQTVAQLVLPFYHLKPSMPSIGGGVHPGMVEKYIGEVGKDIVLAAGGAVQGHPGGAAAGARAMRQAIDIVMSGADFEEAAKEKEELCIALNMWKYVI